jgi:hypothetical protein
MSFLMICGAITLLNADAARLFRQSLLAIAAARGLCQEFREFVCSDVATGTDHTDPLP